MADQEKAPAARKTVNKPDFKQEPLKTMQAIWKQQKQPLCAVCGYQMNDAGECVWDPEHEQPKPKAEAAE